MGATLADLARRLADLQVWQLFLIVAGALAFGVLTDAFVGWAERVSPWSRLNHRPSGPPWWKRRSRPCVR